MATTQRGTIEVRHERGCSGKKCRCRPGYHARIQVDGIRYSQAFRDKSEAVGWLADMTRVRPTLHQHVQKAPELPTINEYGAGPAGARSRRACS